MSFHNRGEVHTQSGKINSDLLIVIAFTLGAAVLTTYFFWGAWTWQLGISGPSERSYMTDQEFEFYEWGQAESVTLVDINDLKLPINGLFTDEDFSALYLIETNKGETQVRTPLRRYSDLEESYFHSKTDQIYADYWKGGWTMSRSPFTDSSDYFPVESYPVIPYEKRNNMIFLGIMSLFMTIYGAKTIFRPKPK